MLMYRTLSILTCLFLVTTAAPTSSAVETWNEDYAAALGGGSSDAYAGVIYNPLIPSVVPLSVCADQCVGGVWITATQAYNFVHVLPYDDVSHTDAPIQLCLSHKTVTYGPPATSYCQSPTIGSTFGSTNSVSFDKISVFVFQLYVDDELVVGAGSSGEVVATFF